VDRSYTGGTAIYTFIQSTLYSWFGTNFIIGPQIKNQIKMLAEKIPAEFQQRELDDLGCGDGKITVLLRELFRPWKLRGFDVNPSLVRRARSKGIQADVMNLERSVPQGELAVMWGVLHHLKDREACLKRISENYSLAFIREPVKNKVIKGLEMGQPLIREEIESLVQKYFPKAGTFYYGHCIFIFYTSGHKTLNSRL
jgi:SAM-dependent methyltransferase